MTRSSVAADGSITETANKIGDFRRLPAGWHFGEGIPPTDEVIQTALALNSEAGNAGFAETNAFPGIDGGIQLTVYYASTYLEFTIGPDGAITFVREQDRHEVEYEEELSLNDALQKIRSVKVAGLPVDST